MSLQLLRSMALHRPTTLRCFQGAARLSTTPGLSSIASETISISTSTSSIAAPVEGSRQKYHVYRTPSNQLPVYHLSKSGGNRKQTKIRKIEGDIGELKAQLEEAFFNKEIKINSLTKQVIIKVR